MRLIKCDKGHHYDADVYSACPSCALDGKEEIITAYSGDDPYIFISYAHADMDRVRPFLKVIKNTHRFWYDEGIPSGSNWGSTLADRINHCTVFCLFLSNTAIESRYVRSEINFAIKYVDIILPVHLERIKLPLELELMLGRFQHIDLQKIGFDASVKKIMESLPAETGFGGKTDEQPEEILKSEPDVKKDSFEDYYESKLILSSRNTGEVISVRQRRTGANYIAKHRIFEDENKTVIRGAARNEFKNLLQLQGKPYAPEIIDFFENEKESYVVISRIHGYTLERVLKNEKCVLTLQTAVSLIYETALVLRDMHGMDLVYCDLKPSNIMLDQYGKINLVDFDNTSTINDQNSIPMATREYAAPEQWERKYAPDARFDVYSLGVLLKELLGHIKPDNPIRIPGFSGDKQNGDPRLGSYISEIQRKMTYPQPGNRYQSMGEVVAVLNLLISWNPEDALRELSQSVISGDITPDDTERDMPLKNNTDVCANPVLLMNEALDKTLDSTEFLSFSADYRF